jgi:methylthioribulose-1-phosphate dehydratase
MVGVILSEKPDTYGILLAGHGLYTWGKTLFEARRHLEILEFLLELTYRKLTLPPL